MLNSVVLGERGDRPPLLIAHGLFGSARNWREISRRLSDSRMVIAVDMRNHGESFWSGTHAYPELAHDLAETIDSHGGSADILGHSMGGKAAMALALRHPETVNRLVVADIAPIAYERDQTSLIRAMRGIDPAAVERRAEADAALAEDVPDPATRAFLLQSLDLKERRWRLNLDTLEAEMDVIVGWPKVAAAAERPALFLRGGDSDYIRPEARPAIKRLFPAASFAEIPGAGHWLHAEKPRVFEAVLRAFLDG